MTTLPDAPAAWPPPPEMVPLVGGLQFKDAAPMICGVVDNGVCQDDPRVLVRLNEAKTFLPHDFFDRSRHGSTPLANSLIPLYSERFAKLNPLAPLEPL